MNRSIYFLGLVFLGFTFMTPSAESATECKDTLGTLSQSVADLGRVVTDSANKVGGLKGDLKGRAVRIGLKAGFVGFFGGDKEAVVKEGIKNTANDLKKDAKNQADKLKDSVKKIREAAACGIGKILPKKKGAEIADDKPEVSPSAFHKDQLDSVTLLFTTDSETPIGDAPSDSSAGGSPMDSSTAAGDVASEDSAVAKKYETFTKEIGDLEDADNSMGNAASNLSKIIEEVSANPDNPELQEKLAQALDEADALADRVSKEADDINVSDLD